MERRNGSFGFGTLAVHGGGGPDPVNRAVSPGIVTSVTFASRFGEIGFSAEGTVEDLAPFAYAREGHPTGRELELRIAALDGGEDAIVFSSGIAAISGLMLHLLEPGDHAVVSDVSYAGTAEFVRGILTRAGIRVSLADMSDLADVEAALRPDTKLVYAETPCNPILKLADIPALAALSGKAGARLAIDSTFATPAVTRPLEPGADFAVYSLTKYYGGHGDAVGGAVVGTASAIRGLRREVGTHLGAMLSPFNAWLIMRGIETLEIRMAAHGRSATRIAGFLERHSFVQEVRYPGLKSHPQYELAQRQMASPAGMIAFRTRDDQVFGGVLERSLRVFSFAASLGLARSLILHCDTADLQRTTFQLDDDHLDRYRALAGDGFFRLTIGLEAVEDLTDDLDRALREAESIRERSA